MQRSLAERLFEEWDVEEEDLNADFGDNGHDHSSGEMFYNIQSRKLKDIAKWIMICLCVWSSYCGISDNALDILIHILLAVINSIATVFPVLACFTLFFPKSINLLKKRLGLHDDKFTKYVVCPKCDSIYRFEDCFFERLGQTEIEKCSHVSQDNHRQEYRRKKCGEPLLKEVILKNGVKRLYPRKVYCYNSVINTLKSFISRPGFTMNCELWRQRNVPTNFLADIFDGQVWKDFMYIDGEPFLAVPNNYSFMLNIDWFQPYKHSLYSVGVMYMVIMNLPRELRFKEENVLLVGVIPGPNEPKLNINSYLQPLVTELNILWEDGIEVDSTIYKAALLCVGCDVPAARKVCGFTSHASCHGCSKCKKAFPGNVSEKMDFSGFESCPPRTNQEHRSQAEDILNQTSQTDKQQKEKEYGTRFTELMMLPYFNCVRFHIIDPMHNLFTGTAKHLMKNIWLNNTSPVIDKNQLINIQNKVDSVCVPSSDGRLPKKIANSYGGFTADQWKSWTIIYSIFALWNILPQEHLEIWRSFVLASSLFCTPTITKTKAQLAHGYLLKFCTEFEKLYGKDKVTPNMHLHMHILDCIVDYGPVYSFWLFSFERYNGILGEYTTNQRAVEVQLMRKFLSDQFVKTLPRPSTCKEFFEPILNRMSTVATGSLGVYNVNCENLASYVVSQKLLSLGPVRKGNSWIIEKQGELLYKCLPPSYICAIDSDFLSYLRESYQAFLNSVTESSVTINCTAVSCVEIAGQVFGACNTRKERSAFIMAAWCGLEGQIDISGVNVRPGVIQQIFKQNIEVNGRHETFIIAEVRWFKEHPSRHAIGAPVEVWCKDIFEIEGPASFIPIQRIQSQFVPAFDIVKKESVLISCPLPSKMQC